ncbi:MAG: MXAN_5187 C-terminal domain-containing protein [Deltaproteobacteria bacterium]|nr:MXAN_5187 C-terminal domain-containing protein [Deltaproteobacteria bacterium]
MAIADDILKLDQQLSELISKYEQYFIGLEKREPLQLLGEVQKIVRRYAGVPINNTMYKHRFNMLVARLNTYREHWNRILKLMEEGKYSRDRFISDLHQRQQAKSESKKSGDSTPEAESDLDRIVREFREARKLCSLPSDKVTRELIAATIEKQKPLLTAKLGSENFTFKVVVENGKPKIKASSRK